MIVRYLFLAIYVALLSTIVAAQNPNWVSLPQGHEVNNDVYFLGEYQDKLVVCGRFSQAGSINTNSIASWDGSSWSGFGKGLFVAVPSPSTRYSTVSKAVVYKDELYVVGDFDTADNIASKYIARWDGNTWHNMGKQPNKYCGNLIVFQNSLYVIGNFDSIGDMPAKRIARWDGNDWHSLPDSSFEFNSILNLIEYNNELVMFGSMGTLDNEPIDGIVRWNGSEWLVFPHGLNYEGNKPIVWNNKLIVGYRSKLVNGEHATIIKQWDGNSWSNFSVSYGAISAGNLYTDNQRLYSCGYLQTNKDTITVFEWDIISASWQGVGNGLFDQTLALRNYNGELYAGGTFNKANGAKHNYLARYTTTTGLQKEVNSKINISVYPNPNNGSFTLQILPTQQTVTCNILDITGKVVYTTIQLNNTSGKITIENTGLTPGIYFCQIVLGDVAVTKKIIITP